MRKLDKIRIHLLKSSQGIIYISSILLENVETKTFHLKSNAIYFRYFNAKKETISKLVENYKMTSICQTVCPRVLENLIVKL